MPPRSALRSRCFPDRLYPHLPNIANLRHPASHIPLPDRPSPRIARRRIALQLPVPLAHPPPHARPAPILRAFHQPSLHGIPMDIPHLAAELSHMWRIPPMPRRRIALKEEAPRSQSRSRWHASRHSWCHPGERSLAGENGEQARASPATPAARPSEIGARRGSVKEARLTEGLAGGQAGQGVASRIDPARSSLDDSARRCQRGCKRLERGCKYPPLRIE